MDSNKGIFACPICAEQFQGQYSKYLHKFIYTNNSDFLLPNHKFRNRLQNQIDGKVENRGPPMIMGPGDWLKKYDYVELKSWEDSFNRGNLIKELEQVVINMPEGMKRKFIFYELPY